VKRQKELGNDFFRAGKIRQAINVKWFERIYHLGLAFIAFPILQAYTDALSTAIADPITPKETTRTILANRSQAYFSYGLIHDSLNDAKDALSSKYTDTDSPKNLTVKCLFRRARILCLMATYEAAIADYEQLVRLVREMGREPTQEQKQLKDDIDLGANAPEGSKRRQKDELMRAIDVRPVLFCT
jgi:tetratricopeptide (TPR) repeat protein